MTRLYLLGEDDFSDIIPFSKDSPFFQHLDQTMEFNKHLINIFASIGNTKDLLKETVMNDDDDKKKLESGEPIILKLKYTQDDESGYGSITHEIHLDSTTTSSFPTTQGMGYPHFDLDGIDEAVVTNATLHTLLNFLRKIKCVEYLVTSLQIFINNRTTKMHILQAALHALYLFEKIPFVKKKTDADKVSGFCKRFLSRLLQLPLNMDAFDLWCDLYNTSMTDQNEWDKVLKPIFNSVCIFNANRMINEKSPSKCLSSACRDILSLNLDAKDITPTLFHTILNSESDGDAMLISTTDVGEHLISQFLTWYGNAPLAFLEGDEWNLLYKHKSKYTIYNPFKSHYYDTSLELDNIVKKINKQKCLICIWINTVPTKNRPNELMKSVKTGESIPLTTLIGMSTSEQAQECAERSLYLHSLSIVKNFCELDEYSSTGGLPSYTEAIVPTDKEYIPPANIQIPRQYWLPQRDLSEWKDFWLNKLHEFFASKIPKNPVLQQNITDIVYKEWLTDDWKYLPQHYEVNQELLNRFERFVELKAGLWVRSRWDVDEFGSRYMTTNAFPSKYEDLKHYFKELINKIEEQTEIWFSEGFSEDELLCVYDIFFMNYIWGDETELFKGQIIGSPSIIRRWKSKRRVFSRVNLEDFKSVYSRYPWKWLELPVELDDTNLQRYVSPQQWHQYVGKTGKIPEWLYERLTNMPSITERRRRCKQQYEIASKSLSEPGHSTGYAKVKLDWLANRDPLCHPYKDSVKFLWTFTDRNNLEWSLVKKDYFIDLQHKWDSFKHCFQQLKHMTIDDKKERIEMINTCKKHLNDVQQIMKYIEKCRSVPWASLFSYYLKKSYESWLQELELLLHEFYVSYVNYDYDKFSKLIQSIQQPTRTTPFRNYTVETKEPFIKIPNHWNNGRLEVTLFMKLFDQSVQLKCDNTYDIDKPMTCLLCFERFKSSTMSRRECSHHIWDDDVTYEFDRQDLEVVPYDWWSWNGILKDIEDLWSTEAICKERILLDLIDKYGYEDVKWGHTPTPSGHRALPYNVPLFFAEYFQLILGSISDEVFKIKDKNFDESLFVALRNAKKSSSPWDQFVSTNKNINEYDVYIMILRLYVLSHDILFSKRKSIEELPFTTLSYEDFLFITREFSNKDVAYLLRDVQWPDTFPLLYRQARKMLMNESHLLTRYETNFQVRTKILECKKNGRCKLCKCEYNACKNTKGCNRTFHVPHEFLTLDEGVTPPFSLITYKNVLGSFFPLLNFIIRN